jgi:hypothetical protein
VLRFVFAVDAGLRIVSRGFHSSTPFANFADFLRDLCDEYATKVRKEFSYCLKGSPGSQSLKTVEF